jgi:hypothetical protein
MGRAQQALKSVAFCRCVGGVCASVHAQGLCARPFNPSNYQCTHVCIHTVYSLKHTLFGGSYRDPQYVRDRRPLDPSEGPS